jgi:hypothetical protein
LERQVPANSKQDDFRADMVLAPSVAGLFNMNLAFWSISLVLDFVAVQIG